MLLGKRARPQIKRTTSMTGITVDLSNVEAPEPLDPQDPMINDLQKDLRVPEEGPLRQNVMVVDSSGYNYRLMSMVSPRYHRRDTGDSIETAHFLRTCGLCNRRLAPARDIYMYRGDTAFCSLECREQQMKHEEKKDKCTMVASKKEEYHHHHDQSASSRATSDANSRKTETVTAA